MDVNRLSSAVLWELINYNCKAFWSGSTDGVALTLPWRFSWGCSNNNCHMTTTIKGIPTSLASMPLLTDHVVWKYSSMRCLICWGRRWTRMKSFRSFMRVWYKERLEYIRWMMAVTFPKTRACMSAIQETQKVINIKRIKINTFADTVSLWFLAFQHTCSNLLICLLF